MTEGTGELWRRRLAGVFAVCEEQKTAGKMPAPRKSVFLLGSTELHVADQIRRQKCALGFLFRITQFAPARLAHDGRVARENQSEHPVSGHLQLLFYTHQFV